MSDDDGQAALHRPYLLVLFNVALWAGTQGERYVDGLWAKDLLEHLRYLPQLTLCCYRSPLQPGEAHAVRIDDDSRFAGLRLIELPRPSGILAALRQVPRTMARLWPELRRCSVVHSSVAGWPLPEAWYLAPMLALRKRPHVIVVESAFWRAEGAARGTWALARRAWSALRERLARACLDRADLAIFTQEAYRRSLLTDPARGHVIEASWIDSEGIVDVEVLARRCSDKLARPGLRIGYFGRLTADKGVLDLMEASRQLQQAGVRHEVVVYGEGVLEEELRMLAQRAGLPVAMQTPVPYGSALFEPMGDCDVIVVTSRTDEQPRVVFDAYSQGIPVLASDTTGHRQCVAPERTGRLFPVGDAAALTAMLQAIGNDKAAWLALAPGCRRAARHHTHEAMHARRRRLLAAVLAAGPCGQPVELRKENGAASDL